MPCTIIVNQLKIKLHPRQAPKTWGMLGVMDMLITLIWWSYNASMYRNTTLNLEVWTIAMCQLNKLKTAESYVWRWRPLIPALGRLSEMEGFRVQGQLGPWSGPCLEKPQTKTPSRNNPPTNLPLSVLDWGKKNVLGLKLGIVAEEEMAQWLKGLTALCIRWLTTT